MYKVPILKQYCKGVFFVFSCFNNEHAPDMVFPSFPLDFLTLKY